jgi:threonine/homoserine/homoserine lactone efflux protein
VTGAPPGWPPWSATRSASFCWALAAGAGLTGLLRAARRLPSGRTPAAAFRASLVTIAANPKAAVFAFSFFPQFLPRHGPVFGTTLALASIQLVLDTTYCVGIVLLASRARRWLSRAAIRRRLERVLGATLVALGIDLAAASR